MACTMIKLGRLKVLGKSLPGGGWVRNFYFGGGVTGGWGGGRGSHNFDVKIKIA